MGPTPLASGMCLFDCLTHQSLGPGQGSGLDLLGVAGA